MRLKLNIDNNTNDFKLSKPQLVGIFRSDKSPVSNDANELYLKYVPKPFTRALELEKGFKMQHLKKFAINNKYEALLEWITLNRQLIQQQFNREEQFNNKLILKNDPNLAIPVDFVLTTGSLSYLLKVPYEETAFTILAERFNGTIYIKIKKKVISLGVYVDFLIVNLIVNLIVHLIINSIFIFQLDSKICKRL